MNYLQLCRGVPTPSDRSGPCRREAGCGVREGTRLSDFHNRMFPPGVLLVLVRVGPPVRKEDGPTAVCDKKLLARRWVRIDTGKGVGEVDDIGGGLGTLRENCSRGSRGSEIQVRVEVPDYEHLVIYTERRAEPHGNQGEY